MSSSQRVRCNCRFAILFGALSLALGGTSLAQNSCGLNSSHGKIHHVIYVQFDNTHFRRDNPNVPSDLEQMPTLLNFIQDNADAGSRYSNHICLHFRHFAYGTGESGYVQQLQNYDRAFQKFFDRLAADGIDKSNTLFVYERFAAVGCEQTGIHSGATQGAG